MENKSEVIRQYVCPQWFLMMGACLAFFIWPVWMFSVYELVEFTWEMISGKAVEPPKIGFMSNYSVPAQNGYWTIVISVVSGSIVLSALMPLLIGAPIGKWILGIRFLDESGEKAGFKNTLSKSLIEIGKILIVMMPGPVLGFFFGSSADNFSLLALFVGLVIVVILTFRTDESGRSIAYRKAGIVPIKKKNIPAFHDAINQWSFI